MGSEYIRISIKFNKTRHSFYIDHLMRGDDSNGIELTEIIIPIPLQLDYIKKNKHNIIYENWCENLSEKFI